jgi:iron complex outermembrane receptor protein
VSGGTEESVYSSAFLGVFPTNLYRPVAAPRPANVTPVDGPRQEVRNASLLASDILSFGTQWSVLLGVRSARLSIDSIDSATGQTLSSNVVTRTAPTAALMFKPSADSLLYLNYAQGVEPGGQAPVGSTNQDQFLPPIVTEQFELGGRIELNGLMLTAALFDLQRPLEYVDPRSGAYVQNGNQQHRGFEFTAAGRVGTDWSVFGGLMWLDPSVTETADPATDGNEPVGVSRFNANMFVEYRFESMPGLFVNAGAYYRGGQYVDLSNTQRIPGVTRFDIGARYETRFGNTPAAFLIAVENVADKSYWADAQNGILTLAEPLTVKATARFSF